MKYKEKIKFAYVGLIILLISLLALWRFVDNKSTSEISNVNELRVLVNSKYNMIRDISPDSEYGEFITEDEFLITIVDLSGSVIFSNKDEGLVGNTVFLDEILYMDQSYIVNEVEYYKISMPIYAQNIVNGFAIFEIEKSMINKPDDEGMYKFVMFASIGIVILFLCILAGWLVFYKGKDELKLLKKGFQDITNGILEPIKVNENQEYKDIYIQYNILVEELGYMIKQQNTYESKRKKFLTILSHELKTPIATINAYVEGLMSGVAKDEASREKYQQIIYQKMQQLTTQIEELFKYAQEESDRFKYNFEECYADELFGGIFDRLESQDKFPVKVQQLIPKCIINADKNRIEQVIMNLYNNALKHSKRADFIKLTGYRQDQEIIIEVADNGDGIDPKDLPYIFDYYYQGKSSKNSDYEGIGLGLAICKDVVSKHQGTIKVRSVLGTGTIFTIILPIV